MITNKNDIVKSLIMLDIKQQVDAYIRIGRYHAPYARYFADFQPRRSRRIQKGIRVKQNGAWVEYGLFESTIWLGYKAQFMRKAFKG